MQLPGRAGDAGALPDLERLPLDGLAADGQASAQRDPPPERDRDRAAQLPPAAPLGAAAAADLADAAAGLESAREPDRQPERLRLAVGAAVGALLQPGRVGDGRAQPVAALAQRLVVDERGDPAAAELGGQRPPDARAASLDLDRAARQRRGVLAGAHVYAGGIVRILLGEPGDLGRRRVIAQPADHRRRVRVGVAGRVDQPQPQRPRPRAWAARARGSRSRRGPAAAPVTHAASAFAATSGSLLSASAGQSL